MNSGFLNFTNQTNMPEEGIHTEQIDRSKLIYFNLVRLLNEVCDQLNEKREVDCLPLLEEVDKLSNIIKTTEHMLMGLAQAPLSYVEKMTGKINYPEIVLYGANTMVYALQIANSLGFPEEKTKYLSIASLFQNIGLLGQPVIEHIDTFDDMLTKLKSSSFEAGEYLELIKIEGFHRESLENIISIIQSRETVLDQTSLHNTLQQYAMIIHICNVFVFLTHERNSDKVLTPAEAMKVMRSEMRDFFHPEVIKLFFNKLSIYPMGTFVSLSSGEIAKIVGVNENFLMRPIVLVVLSSDNEEKIPKQRINLRQNPNIYIKKSMVDDVLTERFIDDF